MATQDTYCKSHKRRILLFRFIIHLLIYLAYLSFNKMADIFLTTFSNSLSCIQLSLALFLMVQIDNRSALVKAMASNRRHAILWPMMTTLLQWISPEYNYFIPTLEMSNYPRRSCLTMASNLNCSLINVHVDNLEHKAQAKATANIFYMSSYRIIGLDFHPKICSYPIYDRPLISNL